MEKHLIKKYDRRLPRYTSYPTAPHFKPCDPIEVLPYVRDLERETDISLYLHIPFCKKRCLFCGCNTEESLDNNRITTYLDFLIKESERYKNLQRHIKNLHLGGGSPSRLTPTMLHKLFAALNESFVFSPFSETAVEFDPRTTTQEFIDALKEFNLTRASIGIQDMTPRVQKAIGREQPFPVVERCVDMIRTAGVEDISLDLVYGLPYQTVDNLKETIDTVLAFAPERLTLFGYAHVPWMMPHQNGIPTDALPDRDARWELYLAMQAHLTEHGYAQIGLDHFTRPGSALEKAYNDRKLRRNFQGYTTDESDTLIGLGASAISALPDTYIANIRSSRAYEEAVGTEGHGAERYFHLSAEDKLRRAIIMSLMCYDRVDIPKEQESFPKARTIQLPLDALNDMKSDGLILWDGKTITMTAAGKPLVRAVCALFDSYYSDTDDKHAQAV